MVLAIKRAREHNIPFLGICLGFQMAVAEWARNVCGLEGTYGHILIIRFQFILLGANSAEFDEATPHPVVVFMPEVSRTHLGGTMRLGLRPTIFSEGTEEWSSARKIYGGAKTIWERHRHRYEVNPEYIERLVNAGDLQFVGKDEKGERMQVMELRGQTNGSII
jgi:CTP synthase